MGMSASQVRFLSLKSRKNTIGRELSTLSNKKLSLSRDMNKVSRNYSNALNKTMLKWSNDSGVSYNALSYDLMMKPNDLNSSVPYIISTRDGRSVLDNKDNLIGRTYDAATGDFSDWGELTGKTFSDNVPEFLQGQSITYENIGKWMSGENNLYTTTDGLLAGRASNNYEIPNGPLDYGFENSLRYKIFEELGLVSTGTTTEYNTLLNQVYGSQDAKEYGNYNKLLLAYKDLANSSAVNITSIDSLAIGDQQFGAFSTYFGQYDATQGKIVGGCTMGNLALAELALEEYDEWCNELKTFNLTESTTFTFTPSSGHTKDWTVQPFLKMNNNVDGVASNADDDGGIANDFGGPQTYSAEDGSTVTLFDTSMLATYGSAENNVSSIVDVSWYDIYNSGNASVSIMQSGEQSMPDVAYFVGAFCSGLAASMEQASDTYSSAGYGTAWKFENNDGTTKMVSDGNGNLITITDAAKQYAWLRTVEFYGTLGSTSSTGKTGCGGCDSDEEFLTRAADQAYNTTATDSEGKTDPNGEYNGFGGSTPDHCWWHGTLAALGGFFGTIGTAIWGGLTWIGTAGQAANWNALGATCELFASVWEGMDPYTTLNMANVEKTYLTYYEMYMQTYLQDDVNLLDLNDPNCSGASQGIGSEVVDLVNNTDEALKAQSVASSASLCNYSTDSNGDTFYTEGLGNGTQFVITTAEHDGVNVTSYDVFWGKFNTTVDGTTYSGQVNKVRTGDEDNASYDTTIYYDNKIKAQSYYQDTDGSYKTKDVEYNKVKIDNAGNITYYNDNTVVQIQTQKTIKTDEAHGLKINGDSSVFSSTITAYINEDPQYIKELEKDVENAQKDVEEKQDAMKNFFANKESKMMDYYDAIFQRMSENGWVSDPKVSSNTIGKEYINNKLQNNDYFVTVCSEKADESGYNFTNKMASSVSKIFEVNDDSEQMQALSQYESEKTLINSKEKKIDARMTQLETEQEAINTELESVKTIISDNVKKTFKMFA